MHHPKKSLGQNFLTDKNIIIKEVGYALPLKGKTVLEIGCGTGLLTGELAKESSRVIAIEKDNELLEECKKRLSAYTNIEYIHADALKTEFPKFDRLVSNLPYSISSKILFKILDHDFELAVVILQKEFAERLVAKPGEKNYSRLSVNATLKAEVELLDTVSGNSFYPAPKVDSRILRLRKKQTPALPGNFDAVLRALFQHKRKSIKNALIGSSHELGLKKPEAKKIFSGFPEKKVITLTPEDIVELSRSIQGKTAGANQPAEQAAKKLMEGTTRTCTQGT